MQEDSIKLRDVIFDATDSKGKEAKVSNEMALAMVDIADRFSRLRKTCQKQIQKIPFGLFTSKNFLRKQQGALSIQEDHFQKVLGSFGIDPQPVAIGDEFDPLRMKAIKYESNSDKIEGEQALVVSEIYLTGYKLGDKTLRPSEVAVEKK
jgi:molecular chaperone GrpE (heat shock protein)